MSILIFGDKRNKAFLQELLNYSKYNNVHFLMTLTVDPLKIQNILDSHKTKNIISFSRPASFFLSKKNIKFKELQLDEFRKTQTLLEK